MTAWAIGLTLALAPAAAPDRCALRVAVVEGNAAQASRVADGSYRGIAVDVARDLARRWNRDLDVVALPPPAIIAALARRDIDLGFVAVNPERGGPVTYSAPYMMVQQTAMVRADSPLRSIAELDRPGLVIGANRGDSIASYLTRTLKHASVRLSPDITLAEAAEWLRAGTVVAFAGNRQRLGSAAAGEGLRLLPDTITAVPQGVAARHDNPLLIAATARALSEQQTSGRLARYLRASRVDGVAPAPAMRSVAAAQVPPCPLR